MKKALVVVLISMFLSGNVWAWSPTYKGIPWGVDITKVGMEMSLISKDAPYEGMTMWLPAAQDKRDGRVPIDRMALITDGVYLIGVRYLTNVRVDPLLDHFINKYGYPETDKLEEISTLYWVFPETIITLEEEQDFFRVTYWDRTAF